MSHALHGLFGGTFDPVHNGHLETVLSVVRTCRLEDVCCIPAGTPAHRRRPQAESVHRHRMLDLAIRDHPQLYVSDIELRRPAHSYSYDTVSELKATHPERIFCFILGMDAMAGLESWHRWRELLDSVHFIVMTRPGAAVPTPLPDWWRAARAESAEALRRTSAGRIHMADVAPCLISSSDIRQRLAEKKDISRLVPAAVSEYIRNHRLYEHDPSRQPT
ncbi:MAG: nicotinate-nucleotide adenylyltransferase [Gammaproteobacteria bacterium]|nr:nicotinate-nucleotide adenylyltransferase [Gammaproteobacteria bacterium]MYD75545.1 nicotinate-nucleotide adenylyltransferase [Gammaproteobacteria bacterium]MYJ53202.1 nicotinate-nucleotide adenylyltransferase [Gammaproteobacteria bacterium]